MTILDSFIDLFRKLPEGPVKVYGRVWVYRIARCVRTGKRRYRFNGVSFQMYHYPFLYGAGMEEPAMRGYVHVRDVRDGDVVIDGGPYSGDFTIYAAIKAGLAGQVIAFEPDPTSAAILASNVRLNGLTNVKIIRKGLWSRDAAMRITGTAFASSITDDESTSCITVDVCSLDAELARLGLQHVDLIKLDIEGAEIEALEGMRETLRQGPAVSIATYHTRNGETTNARVETTLASLGYDARTINPQHQTTIGTPHQPRPAHP